MAHTTSHAAADHSSHGDHGHGSHAVPMKILVGVFAILLVLTVLTVAVTKIDLGSFNIVLAMLIAVVKAAVVALYFMHLRWDSPFNSIVLIAAMFFVALFIGIAVMDTDQYRPELDPPASIRTVQN